MPYLLHHVDTRSPSIAGRPHPTERVSIVDCWMCNMTILRHAQLNLSRSTVSTLLLYDDDDDDDDESKHFFLVVERNSLSSLSAGLGLSALKKRLWEAARGHNSASRISSICEDGTTWVVAGSFGIITLPPTTTVQVPERLGSAVDPARAHTKMIPSDGVCVGRV